MVFDSDSDEDGDGRKVGGVQVQMGSGGGGVQSPRGVFSGSEQGSMFSGSDDDFCILDAPTTTKVVRFVCTTSELQMHVIEAE